MKEKITALIIDDVPLAINSLRGDIESSCPEIEILGTAEGVVSGAKLIKQHQPDLLFLDIEMGDGTGFDLLDLLPEPLPKVIFTTGSNDYAIKAFRYAAIDYLLKPVDPEELVESIARVNIAMTKGQLEMAKDSIDGNDSDKLALNTQQELKIVLIDNIIRCESSNNYTQFFFQDGSKVLVARPLKEFDQMLHPKGFIRTHQSHLVNLQSIQSFQKADGGYLLLKNEAMIPVSVRKKSEVMEALKNI